MTTNTRTKTVTYISGIKMHTKQRRAKLLWFGWWVDVGSYCTDWVDCPYGDMTVIIETEYRYGDL